MMVVCFMRESHGSSQQARQTQWSHQGHDNLIVCCVTFSERESGVLCVDLLFLESGRAHLHGRRIEDRRHLCVDV